MKYYSKSPEEWRKEDQKKNKNDRISQLRARAWKFFFLNVLIVIGAFAFIVFYFKLSGYPVTLFFQRASVKGDVKIFISFNNSAGSFTLGQPVEVLVYAQNTSKVERKLSIEDFSFKIVDQTGKTVYSFLYSSKVERKMKKFEKVLIFDLKREKILNNLEAGRYTVKVNMKLNDSEVMVLKNFDVENKLKLLLVGYQPFYFVGEVPSFNVEVLNENFKSINLFVKDVKVKIEDSNGSVVCSRISKINLEYNLPAKIRSFITKVDSMLRLDRVGIYKQEATLVYNRGELTFSKAFQVISKSMLSVENVKIIVESPIYLKVGESADVNVFLYNESREDRFVLIKEGRVFLQGPEIYSLGNFKNIRVWLSTNEKIAVFNTNHVFDSPGTYKLVVFLQTDNGDLYKELTIKVGGAGE